MDYFLQSALSLDDIFSLHDVKPAIAYFSIKKSAFLLWIKGFKRCMLKTKINQTYAVEITDFLQSVYLKGSDF
jgi:hypothetical protein